MTLSRYDKRNIINNSSDLYSEHLDKRELAFIRQYDTPEIGRDILMKNKDFIYSYHVWSHGDRLWKLAAEHYGDGRLFWLIGLVNSKPTDSHYTLGDLVLIPKPLNLVLAAYGI